MLDDDERRALEAVERRTTAEDPAFVNSLRAGQQQLTAPSGGVDHALIGPVALVVIILLLMGQLTAAVVIASLAAGIGWLTVFRATAGTRR